MRILHQMNIYMENVVISRWQEMSNNFSSNLRLHLIKLLTNSNEQADSYLLLTKFQRDDLQNKQREKERERFKKNQHQSLLMIFI